MSQVNANADAAFEPQAWYENMISTRQKQTESVAAAWLAQTRSHAASIVQQGFPTRRHEAWRYTNIDKVLQQPFVAIETTPDSLTEAEVNDLVLDKDAYRVVFANGRLVSALCKLDGLQDKVTVASLAETLQTKPDELKDWLGQVNPVDSGHIFAALNTAMLDDGMVLHVSAGTKLDKPIEILHIGIGQDSAFVSHVRHVFVLESDAEATVLETYASKQDAVYFTNSVTEVVLADNAVFNHYRVQQESAQAYHVAGVAVKQQANTRYYHNSYAFGAAWSRTDIDVQFHAAGSEAHVNGLYTVGEKQLTDFHLNVEHNHPECHSTENFRGILHGKGRAVFDGRIYVAQDAQQTDAQLANGNLLLTRDAEVDTKPQLEIYADDVKCSHGTTVGQLDDNHVFYLRSRGISLQQAKQMLCLGFAGEIIEECPHEQVKERVTGLLTSRLEQFVNESNRTHVGG